MKIMLSPLTSSSHKSNVKTKSYNQSFSSYNNSTSSLNELFHSRRPQRISRQVSAVKYPRCKRCGYPMDHSEIFCLNCGIENLE